MSPFTQRSRKTSAMQLTKPGWQEAIDNGLRLLRTATGTQEKIMQAAFTLVYDQKYVSARLFYSLKEWFAIICDNVSQNTRCSLKAWLLYGTAAQRGRIIAHNDSAFQFIIRHWALYMRCYTDKNAGNNTHLGLSYDCAAAGRLAPTATSTLMTICN
jgi:hypothetical protein